MSLRNLLSRSVHPPRPARRARIGASAALIVLVVSACNGATAESSKAPDDRVRVSDQHVHGLVRDRGDNAIYLATHAGLLRLVEGRVQRVGPVIDLMGFTAVGPRHFLASGHPGTDLDLPQPLGLVESTDGGASWTVLSRGGESDFHTLTVSPRGVAGFDGTLRISKDKRAWTERQMPSPPATLAASPDGSDLLAATEGGLLRSVDQGSTWTSVGTPALLQYVAWADAQNAIGVAVDGQVLVSRDSGKAWQPAGGTVRLQGVQAMSASTLDDGQVEVLVATAAGIHRSIDRGMTFTLVAS